MLENMVSELKKESELPEINYKEEVLKDFWICCVSRECSILGRKEVLTGKAKFGVFGDGKEVLQAAMFRSFKKGDWRSGYYRDQTFVLANQEFTPEDYFAQMYADAQNDPWSGGRQMLGHFNSVSIDEDGEWANHLEINNMVSDISCTAGQMARSVGLALASKKYREVIELSKTTNFSNDGNEVCFTNIGDASTSEGVFWEAINAAGVLKIPMVVSVYDDGYGISVPTEYQTTKGSISEALAGMNLDEDEKGIAIYKVKAWDYPQLCLVYDEAARNAREKHIPALIHVEDCTQQLGHSTSGSHERYKSKERLEWEKEMDCNRVMEMWLVESGLATQEEVDDIKERARIYVRDGKNKAWNRYFTPIQEKIKEVDGLLNKLASKYPEADLSSFGKELTQLHLPTYSEIIRVARRAKFSLLGKESEEIDQLNQILQQSKDLAFKRYHTGLYSSSKYAALNVPVVAPIYSEESPTLNGYQIINTFFDKALDKYPNIFAFGEDVGQIGDVNQGFAGLQEKYGEERVFDTGIRELTIMGQAMGMAMRGLRPIAEIQYIDYLIYGLQTLVDDVSTLRWRSNNTQQSPVIIRTRGHRLEGIWHSGSPMGMIVSSIRGMYVLTPRNFVQAAGLYNTMLQSDDPAILVECLNGYRLKERLPDNISEFTVPLGVPETLTEGEDITLVTYGSCVRIAEQGAKLLEKVGISVELIDVQTLLPFDLEHRIVESLKKTNRVIFMDEDVPGGATAFMMQEVLEKQGGYRYLDSEPVTITATAHRPPYGSDGDYFSKPNPEDVFEKIYEIMSEAEPQRFY